ncbi:hypothetical protein M885DRAFT_547568 [Pelagophyceae sp. CCMP2097]|nr:hypothetical protein M885DRAFT_547568 [Pelagophyceae sp. CCMP2097]
MGRFPTLALAALACVSAFAPRASPLRRNVARAAEPLPMTEENIEAVLELARQDLGAMFGYAPDSVKVGITGTVDFVECQGPNVILRLDGRFWHERSRVVTRLRAFLQERMPEICDVEVEDEAQLDDQDKRVDKTRW